MEFTLEFEQTLTITQQITITDKHYTVSDVVSGLKNGYLVTQVVSDNGVIVDGNGKVVAIVDDWDCDDVTTNENFRVAT